MNKMNAVVIGATGLIGQSLVIKLLEDDAYGSVKILVRRSYDIVHPKLSACVVDFSDLNSFQHGLGSGDALFCCIGTTQKKVNGDKTAYRKIDYDIAVNAARFAKTNGFNQYLLVSSVGANTKASGFYLQLKGSIEHAISSIGFTSFHIFQPSFLLGDRKEFRIGELIMKLAMKGLSFLFTGSLRKYKAIEASVVAESMMNIAKKGITGEHIYLYDSMMESIPIENS